MSSRFPRESETVYGVPRSHWRCFLSNFDWTQHHPGLRGVISEYIEKFLAGEKPHLVLSGDPGIGKTHLAVGLYRVGVANLGMDQCSFAQVPQFCNMVKASFSEDDAPDFFEVPKVARGVHVLDDIFGRPLSPWEVENVLYRLISYAYDNGAALVATTNYSKSQLADMMNPHELDRLLENVYFVTLSGKSKRPGRPDTP